MIGGYLNVGIDPDRSEVAINVVGEPITHITFSPSQARNLADLLNNKADEIEQQAHPHHFGILVIGGGYPAEMPHH